MAREDIAWALSELGHTRHKDATQAREYYEGKHKLAFEIERFETIFGREFLKELKDNLCAAVIDSLTDRLELTGVSSSAAKREPIEENGVRRIRVEDPLAAEAWSVWGRNRMDQRAGEVHREALIAGDGYVIAEETPNGEAAIWTPAAGEMAVAYSEQFPGELDLAARRWGDRQGRWRLNLFYRDHTERYATKPTPTARPLASAARRLVRLLGGRDTDPSREINYETLEESANPWGQVPVFHFPNKRLYDYGIGELGDVIPLQDGLNKSVCDLFTSMEFAAFPQRWATGLEVDTDETGKPKAPPFMPGVDRIFSVNNAEATFGQFAAADLRQFLEVQESLRAEIARVSGIPLHYLYIAKGDFPSGEAMKSAEARFSKKIRDRQTSFGEVWEQVLAFALRVEDRELPDELELSTKWVTPTPRSEEEEARTLTMKKAIGVPRSQLLREAGYTDEEIELMLQEEPLRTPDPPPAPPDPRGGPPERR